MHLRDLVKQRWADSGLYQVPDVRLKEFLQHIDNTPLQCWPEYVSLFREKYYDLFDVVVPPLFNSRDKLMRTVLIRLADLKQPKEVAYLRTFVRASDPATDQAELKAVLDLKDKALTNEIRKRPELSALFKSPGIKARKPTNVGVSKPAKRRKPLKPAAAARRAAGSKKT